MKGSGSQRGEILPLWAHLAMSGDIWGCHKWRGQCYWPGMLLNTLSCTGSPAQQRIIQTKMSTGWPSPRVYRVENCCPHRNPDLLQWAGSKAKLGAPAPLSTQLHSQGRWKKKTGPEDGPAQACSEKLKRRNGTWEWGALRYSHQAQQRDKTQRFSWIIQVNNAFLLTGN